MEWGEYGPPAPDGAGVLALPLGPHQPAVPQGGGHATPQGREAQVAVPQLLLLLPV